MSMQKIAKRARARKPVNDRGRPIGEQHHRAKLSDADIDLINYLIEEGLSDQEIAAKFDDGVTVTSGYVGRIRRGERRSDLPSSDR